MLKNIILACILLALSIFTFTKVTNYSWDITQNHSNSLTAASKNLLNDLQSTLQITIYSPNIEILNIYDIVLKLYKKQSPYLNYSLEHTLIEPPRAGKLKVYTDNVIVAKYKDTEHAIDIQNDRIAEQQVSTLIQQTLTNTNNWIVFLTGHNEMDPLSDDELGLSGFANLFTKNGMHIAILNLAEQFIPQNTSLVIVANPKQEFLPIEKNILSSYIADGGNIIWFSEPEMANDILVDEFGIKPAKGVIIDPESLGLGSPHPALKILSNYINHPVTKDLHNAVIMPWSTHLQILYEANAWAQTPCLTTSANTWTYLGPATRNLEHLEKSKEHIGPLNVAIALTKQMPNNVEQRALVFADSTFIINKYLPLYANKQLATNIIGWTHNKANVFVYNAPFLKDASFQPNQLNQTLFQYGFTLIIPLILVGIGYVTGKPARKKLQYK